MKSDRLNATRRPLDHRSTSNKNKIKNNLKHSHVKGRFNKIPKNKLLRDTKFRQS